MTSIAVMQKIKSMDRAVAELRETAEKLSDRVEKLEEELARRRPGRPKKDEAA